MPDRRHRLERRDTEACKHVAPLRGWRDVSFATAMPQIDFELDRDHVELNQLLKLVGLCDSGGAGKAIVASAAVSVDGAVELRKTCKIHSGQVVRVGDTEIHVLPAP